MAENEANSPQQTTPAGQGQPSPAARFFFAIFDLLAGKRTTLHKLHLLEKLASVPYRAWERRMLLRLPRLAGDGEQRRRIQDFIDWARAAQVNEHGHSLVLQALIAEERERRPWYHAAGTARALCLSYRFFAWTLARLSLRRALSFNAEFEAHAERTYTRFAADHPEWEARPLAGALAREFGAVAGWAGLLRRIALDERGHRERSQYFGARLPEIANQ